MRPDSVSPELRADLRPSTSSEPFHHLAAVGAPDDRVVLAARAAQLPVAPGWRFTELEPQPRPGEDPLRAVVRAAVDAGAELVLIRRGRVGLTSLLFGSPAERLARLCPLPVLVVRGNARRRYDSVLVGVDFAPATRGAVDLALRVAPAAALSLVHFYDTSYAMVMRQMALATEERLRFLVDAQREAIQRLETFCAPLLVLHPSLERFAYAGDPSVDLWKSARQLDVDLLVVGQHGGLGTDHSLLGSVAGAAVAHAPCDILVAPPVE